MMNAFNSIQSQEEIESMKAMVFKRIKEEIKPDEAIKIAYIPLILMKITKRYTDEIIKICIKNKLNFKREVNEFRELWKLYEQRIPKKKSLELQEQRLMKLPVYLLINRMVILASCGFLLTMSC